MTYALSLCIDSFPSPSSLQLAKVNENELIFAWEPNNGSSSCPSLYYEPVSNCGECTVSLDYAICHTSSVTSDAKVCSFAVRTIICGNTVGTESETVNIILKGLMFYVSSLIIPIQTNAKLSILRN